jgi:hypothetical protein
MPVGSQIGPVVLQTAGDVFTQPAKIVGVLWIGTTVAGDQVVLKHRVGNELLWKAQTDTTNTYLGISFMPFGVAAPNGFYVERIDRGQLLVYLGER